VTNLLSSTLTNLITMVRSRGGCASADWLPCPPRMEQIGGLAMCFRTSWRLSVLAFAMVGPIIYLTQARPVLPLPAATAAAFLCKL
jgi:hypothetical protein